MKTYTAAPLPFVGQKRMFLKAFSNVINRIPGQGEGWRILDVFGGSGLLAHTAKRLKPAAEVVYNDFDGYVRRLENIPQTNRLRREISAIVSVAGVLGKDSALPPETAARIAALLAETTGYDRLTVAAWLCFGGQIKIREFGRAKMYHRVPQADYDAAGYLDGLKIESLPYADLLKKYRPCRKTLMVFDPPYVSTAQGMYNNKLYFGMMDFLRLMDSIAEAESPFVFFSGTKSELPQYIDYQKEKGNILFKDAEIYTRAARLGKMAGYEDNMAFCARGCL